MAYAFVSSSRCTSSHNSASISDRAIITSSNCSHRARGMLLRPDAHRRTVLSVTPSTRAKSDFH